MSWWDAWWLGLIQGLTEFLPVSSSGHLVLAQAILDANAPGVLVEIVLHLATLIAVVVVYWKSIVELTVGAIRLERSALATIGLLALASVPAAVIGVGFSDALENAFDSLLIVGVNLVVTGTILWTTRYLSERRETRPIRTAGALSIGFAQALAILPGISRSGSTISAALWLGVSPAKAAEFSFLMAIPVIAGAGVLQLGDVDGGLAVIDGPLVFSFVVSVLAGILAIKGLLALMGNRRLHHFAPYCWVVGLCTIAWVLVF